MKELRLLEYIEQYGLEAVEVVIRDLKREQKPSWHKLSAALYNLKTKNLRLLQITEATYQSTLARRKESFLVAEPKTEISCSSADSEVNRQPPQVTRYAKGNPKKQQILTEETVLVAVEKVRAGTSQTEVAAELGVTRAAINSIMRGKNWSHVTGIEKGAEFYPRRTLTEESALQAIVWRSEGVPIKEIGRRLGVSTSTVKSIVTGKTWSHVTGIKKNSRLTIPCRVV